MFSSHPLKHYEFLKVSGADSADFLQGQLSADLRLLSETRSLRAALCNIKGRVIADLRLARHGDDIVLATAAGMAEQVQTTLAKYAVFSKVDISPLSDWHSIGLRSVTGASAIEQSWQDFLGETLLSLSIEGLPSAATSQFGEDQQNALGGPDFIAIRPDQTSLRLEVWGQQGSSALTALQRAADHREDIDWLALDACAGDIHLLPEQSEQYTPQLLNFDLSGVIDFKKGCYTGQEVVARMFYRGKAKKRMAIALSTSDLGLTRGDKLQLSTASGEPIEAECLYWGELPEDLAASGSGSSAVVLLIIDAELAGADPCPVLQTLTGEPLQLAALPYTK